MSFGPFMDKASYPEEGLFGFRVETASLKAATESVRLAAASGKDGTRAVRCALTPGRLKLSAYARGAFAEELLGISHPDSIPDAGVAFVLDLDTLAKIAKAFPKDTVTVAFDAKRMLLTVSEGKATVQFTTLPSNQHTDYSVKISFPSFVSDVPTELLQQGLRYAGLFTPPGFDTPVAYIAVQDVSYMVRQDGVAGEVHQGLVAGGSEKTILAFQSPTLRGLNLSAHHSGKDFLIRALGRLDPGGAKLYGTEAFSILVDDRRMFGLERPSGQFPVPLVKEHIRTRPTDFVRAPRDALRSALARVETVSDRTELVQLTVAGQGAAATLTIRMADPSGRMAEDTLPVVRGQPAGVMLGRPREAILNLPILSRLLDHFASAAVAMSFDGPLVRLFDRFPDASATSVLVCEAAPALAKAKPGEAA